MEFIVRNLSFTNLHYSDRFHGKPLILLSALTNPSFSYHFGLHGEGIVWYFLAGDINVKICFRI
jgi:hypothetical protein